RVCGKSRYEVRLPLPQEVGDAIAAYLEGRPKRSRVPAHDRTVPAIPTRRRHLVGGEAPHEAGRHRDARQGSTRSAAHRSDRDAAARRSTRQDRPRPPASRHRHDGLLRKGRCRAAEAGRSALAGGALMLNAIEIYLALRRATGFAMSTAEYLLKSFAAFAVERGQTHVVSQTAIDWAA